LFTRFAAGANAFSGCDDEQRKVVAVELIRRQDIIAQR
jgi:hypothetical protein